MIYVKLEHLKYKILPIFGMIGMCSQIERKAAYVHTIYCVVLFKSTKQKKTESTTNISVYNPDLNVNHHILQ